MYNGTASVGHENWPRTLATPLHPAWQAFIRFCEELGHGELDRLLIEDGLPVLAEVTKQKVKFIKVAGG